MKYLEEKYGEEFEEKYGEGSNYEVMGFYKKGTNPETDVAEMYRKIENGKVIPNQITCTADCYHKQHRNNNLSCPVFQIDFLFSVGIAASI